MIQKDNIQIFNHLILGHNPFSHWVFNIYFKSLILNYKLYFKKFKSVNDGKLHKGFYYGDSSYSFGKKKRSLSTNSSNYYGLPYQIYSATPNYPYKSSLSK